MYILLVLSPMNRKLFVKSIIYLSHLVSTCIMSRKPLWTINGFLEEIISLKTSLNKI